jgi:hypothetical protein
VPTGETSPAPAVQGGTVSWPGFEGTEVLEKNLPEKCVLLRANHDVRHRHRFVADVLWKGRVGTGGTVVIDFDDKVNLEVESARPPEMKTRLIRGYHQGGTCLADPISTWKAGQPPKAPELHRDGHAVTVMQVTQPSDEPSHIATIVCRWTIAESTQFEIGTCRWTPGAGAGVDARTGQVEDTGRGQVFLMIEKDGIYRYISQGKFTASTERLYSEALAGIGEGNIQLRRTFSDWIRDRHSALASARGLLPLAHNLLKSGDPLAVKFVFSSIVSEWTRFDTFLVILETALRKMDGDLRRKNNLNMIETLAVQGMGEEGVNLVDQEARGDRTNKFIIKNFTDGAKKWRAEMVESKEWRRACGSTDRESEVAEFLEAKQNGLDLENINVIVEKYASKIRAGIVSQDGVKFLVDNVERGLNEWLGCVAGYNGFPDMKDGKMKCKVHSIIVNSSELPTVTENADELNSRMSAEDRGLKRLFGDMSEIATTVDGNNKDGLLDAGKGVCSWATNTMYYMPEYTTDDSDSGLHHSYGMSVKNDEAGCKDMAHLTYVIGDIGSRLTDHADALASSEMLHIDASDAYSIRQAFVQHSRSIAPLNKNDTRDPKGLPFWWSELVGLGRSLGIDDIADSKDGAYSLSPSDSVMGPQKDSLVRPRALDVAFARCVWDVQKNLNNVGSGSKSCTAPVGGSVDAPQGAGNTQGGGPQGDGTLGGGTQGDGTLGDGTLGGGTQGGDPLGDGTLGGDTLGDGTLGDGTLGDGTLGDGTLGGGSSADQPPTNQPTTSEPSWIANTLLGGNNIFQQSGLTMAACKSKFEELSALPAGASGASFAPKLGECLVKEKGSQGRESQGTGWWTIRDPTAAPVPLPGTGGAVGPPAKKKVNLGTSSGADLYEDTDYVIKLKNTGYFLGWIEISGWISGFPRKRSVYVVRGTNQGSMNPVVRIVPVDPTDPTKANLYYIAMKDAPTAGGKGNFVAVPSNDEISTPLSNVLFQDSTYEGAKLIIQAPSKENIHYGIFGNSSGTWYSLGAVQDAADITQMLIHWSKDMSLDYLTDSFLWSFQEVDPLTGMVKTP